MWFPFDEGLKVGEVIDQLQFAHDDTTLDNYVRSILEWWYGHREPVGVSEENTGRCQYVVILLQFIVAEKGLATVNIFLAVNGEKLKRRKMLRRLLISNK